MVTRLQFFSYDPNGLGRGRGVYYHRGHGVYSKYSIQRDKKIKAKHYEESRIGLPKSSNILHAGDGWLHKRKL